MQLSLCPSFLTAQNQPVSQHESHKTQDWVYLRPHVDPEIFSWCSVEEITATPRDAGLKGRK